MPPVVLSRHPRPNKNKGASRKEQHMTDEPIRHEAKDKFPATVKYNRIPMEAMVVSKPDNQASMIRGEVRQEVTVRANLHNGNSSDKYTLQFIDERYLPLAQCLKAGCLIKILNVKFKRRHGRNCLESEFEVKAFVVISGELKPALRPR